LGLTLAACDDSTGPEAQQLTASEAAAIAVALDNSSSSAVEEETSEEPSFALLPSNGASHDVITRTDAFNVNLPCPRSGYANLYAALATKINDDEGLTPLDLPAPPSHSASAFRTNEGVDFPVAGTLDFVAARELREGLASACQSHSGSLDYVTSDGKQ